MDTGPRIEVDYQVEFRDFYHALRWYAWRKCWWIYGLMIVAVTFALMTTVFRPDKDPSSSRLNVILPAVIIPVLLAGYLYWGIHRNDKRQFKTNKALCEPRHSIFSEEGSESSSSVSSGKAAWSILHQVLETPESFLFFTSNAGFTVFPKRSLKSDEELQTLRRLIRQNLGPKAKLRD